VFDSIEVVDGRSDHNSDYQVDLDAIPFGAKIGAASLLALLGN